MFNFTCLPSDDKFIFSTPEGSQKTTVGRTKVLHPESALSDQKAMKRALSSVVFILLTAVLSGAQELPTGTILPVALRTTLRTGKMKAGDTVSARLAQYVDVNGMRLPRGTQISGHIVEVWPASTEAGETVTLTFDRIKVQGHDVPIRTTLRAIASMQAVFEAQLPTNLIDDHGSSIGDWNTLQIGGQTVYRGDGTVTEGLQVVGRASIVGEVFGEPKTWPWLACARDRASNTVQSFWVFSTDACGVYDLPGLKLTHAGRSEPIGQIVLESSGKLDIRAGSGWLLVVVSAGEQAQPPLADSRQANVSSSIEAGTHQ